MELTVLSLYFLAVLFFIVAFTYSSVGLGGGSSYTALMAIFGMSIFAIPIISLTLNLFVTSIASYNFIKNKHAKISLILPFLVSSIPMSYLGGMLKLPKEVFYWVLFISLIVIAFKIYLLTNTSRRYSIGQSKRIILSVITGSVLGFVAGSVGIGGGIYLVPLIIIFGLGSEKQAAACGAIFVWLNSLSGLISRLQYNSVDMTAYVPLIIATIAGGTLGSYMGSSRFSAKQMDKILGVIILVAIFLLGRKILF